MSKEYQELRERIALTEEEIKNDLAKHNIFASPRKYQQLFSHRYCFRLGYEYALDKLPKEGWTPPAKRQKPNPSCPKCKGKGEYYFCLPDDVGSPNLVQCTCSEPSTDRVEAIAKMLYDWDCLTKPYDCVEFGHINSSPSAWRSRARDVCTFFPKVEDIDDELGEKIDGVLNNTVPNWRYEHPMVKTEALDQILKLIKEHRG